MNPDDLAWVAFPPVAPADSTRVREFLRALDGLRRERGLSWQRLASKSGLPASTLHAWMSPQRSRLPAWDEISLVVAVCGADEAEWLRRWRVAGRPAISGPAQLPLRSVLTAREAELAELDRLSAGGRPVVVSGTAGVGKTALAVSWAHRVAASFPDGQLYVDLHGYAAERPVPAIDALGGFLHALGVTGARLPVDLDGRAAALRSALTGRRMLMVLDNAGSVEQVRPLLPGTAGVQVLVTSRDALAGLVARDGAQRLVVGLLEPDGAVALLRALLGSRVDSEPVAAAELVRWCARLPLALCIAAELATARADTSLADLVAELAGRESRLALLDVGGDPQTAVRSVFSWSYDRLPEQAARLFRLLGVHPGHQIGAHAAAALAGEPVEPVRSVLDVLTRAHLVRRAGADRYELHDLLRAYAAELAGPASELDSLLDHYLATTAAATAVLHPVDEDRPAPAAPVAPVAPVGDVAAARAWLDAEQANLVDAAGHAAAHGRPGYTVALAATLGRYFAAGPFAEAMSLQQQAIRAARAAGDPAGEAGALDRAGRLFYQIGRHDDAIEALAASSALRVELGDQRGEADGLVVLGAVHRWSGHEQAATDCLHRALELSRACGARRIEADALIGLGGLASAFDKQAEAHEYLAQALDLFTALGDRLAVANVLATIAVVQRDLGEPAESAHSATRALAVCRELGERYGEAYTLNTLAAAVRDLGEHDRAEQLHRQAIEIAADIGEQFAQGVAFDGIGALHTARGRPELAIAEHQRALAIYRTTEVPHSEAAARNSLAEALLATGQVEQARAQFVAALEVAQAAGADRQGDRARQGLDATDR